MTPSPAAAVSDDGGVLTTDASGGLMAAALRLCRHAARPGQSHRRAAPWVALMGPLDTTGGGMALTAPVLALRQLLERTQPPPTLFADWPEATGRWLVTAEDIAAERAYWAERGAYRVEHDDDPEFDSTVPPPKRTATAPHRRPEEATT
jgi:hypothetical protein